MSDTVGKSGDGHDDKNNSDQGYSDQSYPRQGKRSSLNVQAGLEPIRVYFVRLWEILFHPRRFFRKLPEKGGVADPLVFALVTHWIGAAFLYLWHISFQGIFGDLFRKFSRFYYRANSVGFDYLGFGSAPTISDRVLHWFWDTSPIILDPFFTLTLILFHSLWIFVGARIFVAPGKDHHPAEISYATATRVVCFGMTPSILNLFPVLGSWTVSFLTVIYTFIGVKEVYRVSSLRALMITLFPKMIFFGIIIMGSIFFIGTIFKWLLFMFS